jgi:SOS response regulatory protein OraA/RecX
MVLDKDFISTFITSVDSYLSIDLDSALNELRTRGLTDVQIEKTTPTIIQKKEEDQALNSLLKKNKNQTLDYSEDKSKITDYWTEEKEYVYDLILQT